MYILLFFIIFILIMQVSLWNAIFNLNEIVCFFFCFYQKDTWILCDKF